MDNFLKNPGLLTKGINLRVKYDECCNYSLNYNYTVLILIFSSK